MQFNRVKLQILVLFGASMFLTGCNPATMGWSSAQGTSVSSDMLVAAKQGCGYHKARKRAIYLLDARGDKQKNEDRAARLLNDAERCMVKRGVHHKGSTAFGIGPRRLK